MNREREKYPARASVAVGAPKYGFCNYATPHNTVFDDIEQLVRTGGSGIGLSELKLPPGEDARVLDAMKARGVRSLFCVPSSHTLLGMTFGPFRGAKHTISQRVDMICASIERLAKFDPLAIVVAPGVSGDPAHPAGPLDEALAAMPVIADFAAEHGQTVAFELLGERKGSPLHSIPDMVAAIKQINRPNVGFLFDIHHSWPEPSLHEHIRENIDYILGVQVSDVKVDERDGIDREMPGRGRAVAVPIMATLLECGYDGWWEMEVFSDDGTYFGPIPNSYWAIPHEEFLAIAKQAFDTCYAAAVEVVNQRRGRS